MGTSLQVARRSLARLGDRGRTTAIPGEVREVLVSYALEQRGRGKAAGHGPSVQPALPRMEQVHALGEADGRCPQCGGELEEMSGQSEESEEIDVVERSFRIVVQQRQKYRCRCGGCVETARGPVWSRNTIRRNFNRLR